MKKTISLPQSYTDQLEAEKERTGAPMSEIIRRALDYYFSSAEVWNKKLDGKDT